jgi:hypothetical protein
MLIVDNEMTILLLYLIYSGCNNYGLGNKWTVLPFQPHLAPMLRSTLITTVGHGMNNDQLLAHTRTIPLRLNHLFHHRGIAGVTIVNGCIPCYSDYSSFSMPSSSLSSSSAPTWARQQKRVGEKEAKEGKNALESKSKSHIETSHGLSVTTSIDHDQQLKHKGEEEEAIANDSNNDEILERRGDDGQDAIQLIRSFTDDSVICFTDGACIGNPGPAGAAAVICLPHEPSGKSVIESPLRGPTNNKKEPPPTPVTVLSLQEHNQLLQAASRRKPKNDGYYKGRSKQMAIAKPGAKLVGEWCEASAALGNVMYTKFHQLLSCVTYMMAAGHNHVLIQPSGLYV